MKIALLWSLLLFTTICTPLIGWAQTDPIVHRYHVYIRGVPVGYILASLQKENDEVKMRFHGRATGAAKAITKFKLFTDGILTHQGDTIVPKQFITSSKLRKRHRKIHIDYDPQGQIIFENVAPADKRWKRPAVSASLKQQTLDPLSIAYQLREDIRRYRIHGGNPVLNYPLYEGRRRSNLSVTIMGEKSIQLDKKSHHVIHIHVRRVPVEGFTESELKDYHTFKPNVDVYLENNDRLLPLYAQGSAPDYIRFTVEKVAECSTLKACEP